MYKKNGKTFVGIRDGLMAGEVISIKPLGLKYKIIGQMIKKIPQGGGLYRVKRVDGANTTNTDLQNALVGNKVRITNRRSFQQMFAQVPYNENLELPEPPCPPKYSAYECDRPCVGCGQPNTSNDPSQPTMMRYSYTRGDGFAPITVKYDTLGGSEEFVVGGCKLDCPTIEFCAIPYTIIIGGVTTIAINEPCPGEETCIKEEGLVAGETC